MGTDIHLFVERRCFNPLDKNNEFTWVSIDKWSINPYSQFKSGPRWSTEPRWEVAAKDEMYWKRNYVLFALLANVRNTYNITPISAPRGLPNDVTKEIRIISDYEGIENHSHSWYLLKDLNEFNWSSTFKASDGSDVAYQYRETCPDFMEFLIRLNRIDSEENIRIVFWFDN